MRRVSVVVALVLAACGAREAPPKVAEQVGGAARAPVSSRYGSWRPARAPRGGTFATPPSATSRHPVVDMEELRAVFPLAAMEAGGVRIDGSVLSSPEDLAVLEQVRERARVEGKDLGKGVPVDAFLWADGEPPRPYLTKLGGVPHRERALPWPVTDGEEPMTFVAQFCFADSRDVLDVDLPGDLLLVFFGEECPWPTAGQPAPIHLEWGKIELADATKAADVPAPGFAVPVLHGVRHRTMEYPAAFYEDDVFAAMGYSSSYHFAITQSTSIGHETWFIQNDPRGRRDKLLCALSSFQPRRIWPLCDKESVADPGRSGLMFADLGCYYFVMDRGGRVRAEFDCY